MSSMEATRPIRGRRTSEMDGISKTPRRPKVCVEKARRETLNTFYIKKKAIFPK